MIVLQFLDHVALDVNRDGFVDSVMMSLVEDFAFVDSLGAEVVIMSLFVVEGESLVDVVLTGFSVVGVEVVNGFMEVVVDALVVFCDGVLVTGICVVAVPCVVVLVFTVVTDEVVVGVGVVVLVTSQSPSHGQLQPSRS